MTKRTDIGALAAAAIAVPLTMFGTPGPYDAVSFIVGVTLLALIFGYAYPHSEGNIRQQCAIACVVGLAAIPAVGAVIDIFHSYIGSDCTKLKIINCCRVYDSCVGDWTHVGIWFLVAFLTLGFSYFPHKKSNQDITSSSTRCFHRSARVLIFPTRNAKGEARKQIEAASAATHSPDSPTIGRLG